MTITSTFATAVVPLLADAGDWDHMGGWGWGMAITGWVFMLSLIALAGWAIWAASTGPERTEGGPDETAHAKSVLAERYARGEIDRDEYLERRRDLETHHG
ncbi:MAG TPA: SHOCT domain-containing protein [Acidimicrobiia bacterium]|nr:SHOCT domain-containing protein [Acidimicrobiia bacterium]